ncbi:MAG: hypothetical protein ACFB4J_13465 [Elainellaceae cyanobacterium]
MLNQFSPLVVTVATGFVLMNSSASVVAHPLQAQPPQAQPLQATQLIDVDLVRARNLARQAAERENGGILSYRAEPAMHGPAQETPFIENLDGSRTFTFQGCSTDLIDSSGQCTAYTIESVVTVAPSGRVTLNENRTLP